MVSSLEEMLPILRCPRTYTRLRFSNGRLTSEAGEEYFLVDKKPILVRYPRDLNLNPPDKDKISRNLPHYTVPLTLRSANTRILHLGSGDIPCPDPRVISVDVLPLPNVDLVAEAEDLPFLDASFDYVESGAVFEHLYDPIQAIKEVKRILKPQGLFRVDTAFMQSFHGFPDHYFNFTPLAVETYLLNDFVMEESYVPDSATPLKGIVDLVERFLSYLPEKKKTELMACSLNEFLKRIGSDTTRRNELLSTFSEYALRSMAASFVVSGRKPERWSEAIEEMSNQNALLEKWELLKREYYALRMEVMLRHHEVLYYRRLCQEAGVSGSGVLADVDSIDAILTRCKVADPLSTQSLQNSVACLRDIEIVLRRIRDDWIRTHLSSRSK